MNINARYVSSARNPSGYGEAARNFITALFVSGVNLSTETISQMPETTSYGLNGGILTNLEGRKIPSKITIVHLTPDLLPVYKNGYTISHLFWETDRLPKEWVQPLNGIDEVWTGSETMAEMIKKSGVTTPCYIFPQPIFTGRGEESIEPFLFPYPKDFTFYSIFQWIDRKNPKGLLMAYWKAFEGNDKVSLLLKTHRVNYSDAEFSILKKEIEGWKKEASLNHYPKIYLCRNLLTDTQMLKLHKTGDCFVNPSTGEGWNRPIMEAMLMGKPCISGSHGGITDYTTNYFPVPSKPQKATSQNHIPWYTDQMLWQMLDEKELGKAMLEVFNNYEKAVKVGRKAQEYVMNNFSFQKVGALMLQRLEQIYATL